MMKGKEFLECYKAALYRKSYYDMVIKDLKKDYTRHYNHINSRTKEHIQKIYQDYLDIAKKAEKQILYTEKCINELPEPYKSIIFQYYKENKPYEKIADDLFYSKTTIAARIREAFKLLEVKEVK